jgi:hypothetical protein
VYAAGGAFWILGGVMGDKVFASSDGASWHPVTIPVAAAYWTAGTPAQVDGIGVVIPVTTHGDGASQVTFLASQDAGASWRTLGSVDGPHTEFSTTLPTSITPDGNWMTLWPDASKVASGNLTNIAAPLIVSPNGLAGNAYGVVLLSATEAYASSAPDSCPGGNQPCTSTTLLLHSADGGQTWAPIS